MHRLCAISCWETGIRVLNVRPALRGKVQNQPGRLPQDVTFPNFEPKLYPRLLESVEQSAGANLRFKTPELAATTRFARRG
jgi:hypothetical protein